MCTNRRSIFNRYIGKSMVVDCGRCPSCLQAKANKRAFRVQSEFNPELDDRTFVTLTYKNKYIPYLKDNDVQYFFSKLSEKRKLSDIDYNKYNLPVYRDFERRLVYDPKNRVYKEKDFRLKKPIKFYTKKDFETSNFDVDSIKSTWYNFLRKKGDRFNSVELGKIGICYYKDVQNFMKRLRINLKRIGYDHKIRFFACTEYGPTTTRPHIHVLLFHRRGDHSLIKNTVVKSWFYDDIERRFDNIEKAYAPTQYLASYVNCDSTVKGLLRDLKPFKMRHSYSQGFGVNQDSLSLASLEKMYRRGDYGITRGVIKDGVSTVIVVPVPSYVISRYFPKFKGYHNLTSVEVYNLIQKPEFISSFASKLNMDSSESKRTYIKLLNLKKRFGNNLYYAELYANIWQNYNAYKLRLFHDTVYKLDPLEAYDNIVQYYSGEIDSDFVSWDDRKVFQVDYNKFKCVVSKTSRLIRLYNQTSKDKKVKDLAYSFTQNV